MAAARRRPAGRRRTIPDVVLDPASARSAADGTRFRILLADDNADMRDYLRNLLARQYEVRAVADGLSALESARSDPPDLILADVMMPGLDGFGLLRELRGDDRTRELPVLLLSARAGEEARVEGLEAGADDYLTKPVGARELLARVASQLDRVQLRRQAEQERRRGDERARAILESITDAFFALDRSWVFTYVNRQALRLLDRRPGELLGRSLWDVYPGLAGSEFERVYREVAESRVPQEVTSYYPDHDRWYEVHVYPASEGITIYFRDASERIRAASERERLVSDLRDADRRKDEFLAMLGHELRNPLAPIQQRRPDPQDDRRARRAPGGRPRHDRAAGAAALPASVDDLLDVSRIMRGNRRTAVGAAGPRRGDRSGRRDGPPLIDCSGTGSRSRCPRGRCPCRATGSGSRRSSATCSTTRPSTPSPAAGSSWTPGEATARWSSACGTTARASRRRCCRRCSICSSRPTARSTARRAAWASA